MLSILLQMFFNCNFSCGLFKLGTRHPGLDENQVCVIVLLLLLLLLLFLKC